jgi:hypothetical protein
MRFLAPALMALLLSLLSVACGGSSSETPPPLEPDPTSLRYTGPRLPSADDTPAPAAAPEPDEDDVPVTPKKPAAGTWGSGKAAVPAPAPSSERAGQR